MLRRPASRRSFLETLAALGAASLWPSSGRAAAAPPPADGPWDLAWLDQLAGRHRQVFDLQSLGNARVGPVHIVRNYLDAHRDVSHLEHPAVNTVVGIAYAAFPVNAADALWEKYRIGERWQVKDSKTGAWAVRNPWAGGDPSDPHYSESVAALKARGTIFWQCDNALHAIVGELSAAFAASPESVRADLVGGLLPGTKLIPAHTMLIGLAQEHGCTYERV